MTTDKLKIQRDLKALHPYCSKQAKKVLADCKKQGLNVALFEALRTLERQKTLKTKGKSKTLNSYHRLGLAVDIVFKTSKGNWTWNRPKEDWDKLAEIAEKHGFSSGWRWKRFKDGPHMEIRFPGVRTSELYSVLNKSNRQGFYGYVGGLVLAHKLDSQDKVGIPVYTGKIADVKVEVDSSTIIYKAVDKNTIKESKPKKSSFWAWLMSLFGGK